MNKSVKCPECGEIIDSIPSSMTKSQAIAQHKLLSLKHDKRWNERNNKGVNEQ